MQHATQTSRDPRVIRDWVEKREGAPATVKETKRGDEPAGVLRIKFPGHGEDKNLKSIPWDDFFDKFNKEHLSFVHQEKTEDGSISRFCKIVEDED